ncbi:hypothetical protein [Achromobacter mucicolens]|uniref:hypothetical protein n=1 Tax=Achromobacter mucicolens TaxID=1389922 RepID=UPI00289CC989|nr:hypothetical protein [Achromobacter mucicolens]
MQSNQTRNSGRIKKSWSYKQLTEATEARIRSDASFLKRHLKELQDPRDAHRTVMQVSSWSHGAFLLWLCLTSGWQQEGDEKRLRELVDSVGDVNA